MADRFMDSLCRASLVVRQLWQETRSSALCVELGVQFSKATRLAKVICDRGNEAGACSRVKVFGMLRAGAAIFVDELHLDMATWTFFMKAL